MPTKRRFLILACVAAAAMALWIFRSQFILACVPFLERKGESGGQWLRDSLILCGPSSIQPTIDTLRRESPWNRNCCYLPDVLRYFGEPARQQLLVAIDSEEDRRSRAHLISTLQRAFKDFTRLDRWLADQDSKSAYVVFSMASDVRLAFPEAPSLKSESTNTLNPDFLLWWQTHQAK